MPIQARAMGVGTQKVRSERLSRQQGVRIASQLVAENAAISYSGIIRMWPEQPAAIHGRCSILVYLLIGHPYPSLLIYSTVVHTSSLRVSRYYLCPASDPPAKQVSRHISVPHKGRARLVLPSKSLPHTRPQRRMIRSLTPNLRHITAFAPIGRRRLARKSRFSRSVFRQV